MDVRELTSEGENLMVNYGKLMTGLLQEGKFQTLQNEPKQQHFYLQHSDADFNIQVRFKEAEKYAILVDYISVARVDQSLTVEEINKYLNNQAETVQKRITFLLEEFKLIEQDRQNKRAQLRSYPPHAAENNKFYYEIVLDEGIKAHFQRYQFSREGKRYEKILSLLTMETFERLIDELVAALKID